MTSAADRPAQPRSTAPRHHYRPPDPAELIDQPVGESDAVIQGPVPPRPWYLLVAGQWPLFVTLLTVGAGIAMTLTSHWRAGSSIAGAGLLLGAALRAVVPERSIGLLACRSRWVDVAITALLGVGVVTLAWLIEPGRP